MTRKKKHILFYLSGLAQGGTERVVVNLAEYFIEQGYIVTIATTHKTEKEYLISNKIHRVLTSPGHDFISNSRVRNFFVRLKTLRKVLKDQNPDVVVSFIGKNNMMAILASTFLAIPVYVAVRGEPTEEYAGKMMRLVSKTLFYFSKGIILQTKQSMDYFPKPLRKKCVIMKNPLKAEFLEENNREHVENTIVTVGRCDANKNQKLLIDGFSIIAHKYPDTQTIIYGDGELREELIQYVRKLGLENQIKLPGLINNTRETIRNASIFVLTSNTEGMPNALIEAMVLGLPVISTDCPCGGPATLIEQNRNGILIGVNNKEQLAENLDKLLSKKDLRNSLGKEAAKMKELLHPDLVNKEWEKYLLQ